MSKIEDEQRFDLLKTVKMNETYEWQVDSQENHRLVHFFSETASDWQINTAPAVLHDKFVMPNFFNSFLPTERLLRWEVVNI